MWVSLLLESATMGPVSKQRQFAVLALSFLLLIVVCDGLPTIYKRNSEDMLEPVLIPISSTVIPLPVYKVGVSIGIEGEKPLNKQPTDTKLVTLASSRKKAWLKEKSKEQAKIKPISQEEFVNSKELL